MGSYQMGTLQEGLYGLHSVPLPQNVPFRKAFVDFISLLKLGVQGLMSLVAGYQTETYPAGSVLEK